MFLKRKPNEMRINLFNGKILLAWKANLDIQIVLEPYGCASYIVGYISKSQRGMSAQHDAAAKEARKGNFDLKKQIRHIGNVFSNCVEVSAQEAVYHALQIPLTKCTRDFVFINTSTPKERIVLLKSKSVLDELPAESTNVESDNIMQRNPKRPKQLQEFCLADYVSKVNVIYPKGNKLPEKIEEKMMTIITMKEVLVMKMKTVLKMRIMLRTAIVQTYYTKQRMEQDIRKEKYLE